MVNTTKLIKYIYYDTEQFMETMSVRTSDSDLVRLLDIDTRLFSELQDKVTSLELKANNLEELSTTILAGSESNKENINNSNNIFEEVKILNEKIIILEKENIEKCGSSPASAMARRSAGSSRSSRDARARLSLQAPSRVPWRLTCAAADSAFGVRAARAIL